MPAQHGLEAWRRVFIDVVQKTQAERLRLEDAVLSASPCARLTGVAMALERWEASRLEYREATGAPLPQDKRIGP